jgi:dTDP-4-amino-4,6-dideoxygalactose transaminase
LDYQKVKALLENAKEGEFSGIISVDFAGRVCNQEAFKDLSKKHNLWYLSDSCHSPGGYFIDSNDNNVKSGSNRYSDASIFSFHPVKHIAAGEGGIITTNDEKLYTKLLLLRSHGIERRPQKFVASKSEAFGNFNEIDEDYPGWYMEMQHLGYNYRMPDILAALANSQLGRARDGIAARLRIAKYYTEFFEHKSYIHGLSGYVEGHAYHLYVIEVAKRDELYKHLKEHGVYCQIHYLPIYRMPYYKRQINYSGLELKNVESYYSRCLSIPIFPTLELESLKKVTQLIEGFYE